MFEWLWRVTLTDVALVLILGAICMYGARMLAEVRRVNHHLRALRDDEDRQRAQAERHLLSRRNGMATVRIVVREIEAEPKNADGGRTIAISGDAVGDGIGYCALTFATHGDLDRLRQALDAP